MATVNPIQTNTYYLTSGNNPITFGAGTGIDVSSGSGIGVYGSNVQSWAVTNKGAISGGLYGVNLAGGGSVTNKAGATISGGHVNVVKGAYGYNYYYGFGGGVKIAGGAGTVTNAGAINSPGLYGIELTAGGAVTNEAGATITSSHNAAIEISGSTGTVTNAGNINGYFFGVELQAGGSVTNKAGGTISGGFEGVALYAVGTVTNEAGGTISGFGAGVDLTAGGAVTNEAGATISGYEGVRIAGGSVTNEAGAMISGVGYGIRAVRLTTVTNAGAITTSPARLGEGVILYAGGSVVNEAGATISGALGVFLFSGGTIINSGDIIGSTTGVELLQGGSVTNRCGGTISAYSRAISLSDGGSVVNQAGGTITGDLFGVWGQRNIVVTNSGAIAGTKLGAGNGVFSTSGGTVTNNSAGTITGGAHGVYIAGGGSVTNAGAISGATASVQFGGAGANTLTLDTGSTLTGDAIGSTASGATNALILQGHGTADNNFDNFNTLNVQANGNWTLGGDSTFDATTVSSGSLIVAGDVSGGATTLGDSAGDLAQIVIASTGAWDLLGDSGISLGGPAPSLIKNSGLIEKTDGSGTSAIAPQLVNKGSVLVSSGALDLEGAVSGNGADTVSGASTLEFDSTVGGGQTAGFTGGGGALDLIDPLGFAAKISGFAATDTVELSGDWAFSSFSETGNGMMGTLTLSSGSNQLALHFLGDYTASDFKIASGATTTIGHT